MKKSESTIIQHRPYQVDTTLPLPFPSSELSRRKLGMNPHHRHHHHHHPLSQDLLQFTTMPMSPLNPTPTLGFRSYNPSSSLQNYTSSNFLLESHPHMHTITSTSISHSPHHHHHHHEGANSKNNSTSISIYNKNNNGSSSKLTLTQLYPEVLCEIFYYLDSREKARVSQTCQYFNQVMKNKQVWKSTEARLNLRANQSQVYNSMIEKGVDRVQVLSLKRSLRELTSYIKLTHLKLSGCYNVTDSSLSSMSRLESLTELDLSLCKQITDTGLAYLLGKFPKLEVLSLGGCCNLTDRATLIISYGLRTLKKLDLRSCYSLTDKSLAYLSGEVKIQENDIKTYVFLSKVGLFDIDCSICTKASRVIKHSVPLEKIQFGTTEFGLHLLETLILQDCQKISDSSLQFIGKFIKLKSLNLSFCINITDGGLKHLSEVKSTLKELNLRSCENVSNIGFQNLRECPAIESLDVSFCERISSLNQIVCRNLKTLSLSACDINDDSFVEIQMGNLATLNLGQCNNITNSGFLSIMDRCPNLSYMDLYGCSKISPSVIESAKNRPNSKLRYINLGLWKI